MTDRVPVVIEHEAAEEEVIDLTDPKWGGKGDEEEVEPVMDEAWCRKRLWEIACLLRKQTKGTPNQLVIGALSSEAAIVKSLLPKKSEGPKRPDEVDDEELQEKVQRLKDEGKI